MSPFVFEKSLPEAVTKADNLPTLPTVALDVLRLTQDDESTIDDLANCLSRDPALAAKLLKLSNSPLFGVGQEITTLQRATMVLGMKTVKLMSLSFSLASSLPKEGRASGFDLVDYWRRSMVQAVAAKSLAKLVGSRLGDEAFLCGLLAHFGRLVLARVLPEAYEPVVAECRGWPTPVEEEARLGFTNTDVCATLLRTWQLPELVYLAVAYAHSPEALPAEAKRELRELVELLGLTGLVETILCDEEKGPSLHALHERIQQRFGLSATEVDAFLIGLESGIAETGQMLSLQLPPGTSHEEVMNQARLQIVNVSLGAAVDLQELRRQNERLQEEKARLADQARTDRLTGLTNRVAFDEFLEHHVLSRVQSRQHLALGLILLDVDRFKRFNDTHGHAAGDEVLRMIGRVLQRETRRGDLSARYGGEEFALIILNTNPFGLKTVAERIRTAIANEVVLFEGQSLSVTATFGGACIAEFSSREEGQALVRLADHHLYKAKEAGRNRSEIYPAVRFLAR